MDYEQVNNYLEHTMNPGEMSSSIRKGTVWITDAEFLKSDTLITSSGKVYNGK